MRLPAIKKLLMEDFQDQGSWIGRLVGPLNLFMTTLTNGLSNGLTVQENMLAQVKTVLIAGSTPTTSFQYPFSIKPIGCLAIAASELDQTPALNPQIKWVHSGGLINITVNGLDVNKSYYITFHVIGG